MAFEYIVGGAGDEATLRWNREAFEKIKLNPRVLVDVSRVDPSVTLLGERMETPILLAPTAYHRLVHPEGEIATARAAARARATMVLSSFANTGVEEVARAAGAPLWFQLYVQRDRGQTREMVRRAEDAGCRALCVTVDTPVRGARNREERSAFALPPGLGLPNLGLRPGTQATAQGHTASESEIYSAILDPTLTWKEIEWLRGFARVPVLLKGILNPDDADRAVKAGVSGLLVSNHGARNLDTVPASIDALPRVARVVAGRIPLLVDGGVRRGTDVLKALALGASAVLIGRPYLFALGAGGEDGVARALSILRREFEAAMALCGRRTVPEIDATVLW
jgi:4-hydroxymandelate oxidase